MLQRTKNLLKDNSLYIAIFITSLIAFLSLKDSGPQLLDISNIDKFEHAFAYCVLSVSWLSFFYQKKTRLIYVVLGCILYGIVIEVLQETLTLHRTAELLDVVANSTGVALGLLIFSQISKKNQVN